jgi:hypothetical protein
MGPRRHRFWFPLVRLGAFFGAVVVAGNVLLQGAFTPADPDSDPDRRTDFIGRSKRRLEKRLRAIERLFFGSGREVAEDSGAIFLADPELEPAQDSGPIAAADPAAGSLPETMTVHESPTLLPVAWPVIPEPLAPRPPVERLSLELSLTPELVERFYRSGAPDPLGDFGDVLLRGPEALMDGALRCLIGLLPRSDTYSVRGESTSGITGRIFDFQIGTRESRIFTEFASNWLDREERYLSRFGESEFDTVGVENGTEDVDVRGLLRDQGKVLWDAARKTYFSKYKFRGEERIQNDAFSVGEWRGVDFVVLPPLVAGYLWYRGLEKRVSLGDTWLRVSVEPLSRWVTGKADMVAGVSVEWGIKGIPVGLILSAGKYDGKAELDFVGIGTSVGMVRKVLENQVGDSSARSWGRAW